MLKCRDVAARASDYLDKQLDAKISFQMRLHLLMCAHCRRFVRQLKLTRNLTQQLVIEPEATTDPEAILRKIKAREATNSPERVRPLTKDN